MHGRFRFRIKLWPYYTLNFISGCRSALFKAFVLYLMPIRSLYFDSHDNECLYAKQSGDMFRQKYRIRIYDTKSETVKFEIKNKRNNQIFKETAAITKKRSSNAAYWSFSQYAGPVCMTDDGLEFQFREMSGMKQKRAACSRVVAELYDLVYALARKRGQGNTVDWWALQISPIAGSEEHRVMLNTSAEIRLSLPGLAASKDLLRIVRPWLAARVNGEEFHLVVLNAGDLLQGVGEYP